jgi:hypothetical protein
MNHEEIHEDDVPEHGTGHDVQKGSNGGDKDWTKGVI